MGEYDHERVKQKDNIIGAIHTIKPELSEESIRNKIDSLELNSVDLEKVSGGGGLDRIPLDANKEVRGWTYTQLHSTLCWFYESYHIPGEIPNNAKALTLEVANDIIPAPYLWQEFRNLPYPDFIEEPMWRIWCPSEYEA